MENHPPDLQKINNGPPKVKFSPENETKKRVTPKSTPDLQKVNIDPPRVISEPVSPKSPKSQGYKTLQQAITLTNSPQKENQEAKPVNLKTNPFFILKGEGSKTLQPVKKPTPESKLHPSPKEGGTKPTEPLKTKPVNRKNQTRNQTTHTPPLQ